MNIIKLDAIDSTNSFLKEMISKQEVADYTVVVAEYQTNGRGQMGALWSSNKGENLMFSLFKDLSKHDVEYPFYISMAISLAILKTLKTLNIPDLRIKWPNDILSANKKICGILIENVIKNRLNSTIIGVGVNVNQTKFCDLPKASSLKNITGIHYNLDEILGSIIKDTKHYSSLLQQEKYDAVKNEYEESLFRKNKPSTFKNTDGLLFSGFIKGVTKYGKLQVILEDEIVKKFDLKEITLLY
ncbi:BirA family transcriptional regulator, biotin operon repressor / biotin-[acetyl-CoA-carboxylase] ligase [Flaviramulus basaltis]|uniref:BirA family transcriptional regulator, biotin operon repressor / biotin-[acetyl-CoA-carboxylase] ligase n=1 Tax=Flaviramulus basaltis TaxID=369401 RepID=A0A1K2IBU0_9FLAO|nr:biotin--[acetyl-CoA-carboxylase] ligase [Flaviramulus basaltis]SFZ89179.1 BirA family transcriptional regulator, biotin operon repressor / biotin-[acetyl-CoA-carboxylase] ligase [Flaviramulus basaltis]